MSVVLDVKLNDEVIEALKVIADKRGISATEAVSRAIAWFKFFDDAQVAHRQVRLVNPKTEEVSEITMRP